MVDRTPFGHDTVEDAARIHVLQVLTGVRAGKNLAHHLMKCSVVMGLDDLQLWWSKLPSHRSVTNFIVDEFVDDLSANLVA